MQGRIYDERTIHLFYVPRDLYYQNYKKNLTPPAIKDNKWSSRINCYKYNLNKLIYISNIENVVVTRSIKQSTCDLLRLCVLGQYYSISLFAFDIPVEIDDFDCDLQVVE